MNEPLDAAIGDLVCVCVTGVCAEPGYPKDVQAMLDRAAKFCRDEGGTGTEFSAEDIRKIDLTGDGRDDYIVHLQNAKCAEREAVFSGTGARPRHPELLQDPAHHG